MTMVREWYFKGINFSKLISSVMVPLVMKNTLIQYFMRIKGDLSEMMDLVK